MFYSRLEINIIHVFVGKLMNASVWNAFIANASVCAHVSHTCVCYSDVGNTFSLICSVLT